MSKKNYFNNKIGFLEVEEFIKMIHDNSIDKYIRAFNPIRMKCPPKRLVSAKASPCFYCTQCQQECIERVKEYKKYYKVGKMKYQKEDLDNMEDVNYGDM